MIDIEYWNEVGRSAIAFWRLSPEERGRARGEARPIYHPWELDPPDWESVFGKATRG